MKIKTINITEAPAYSKNKGKFEARITMDGGASYPADVTIGIPDDVLQPIVDIIAQAVVQSMAQAANDFRESVAASLAGPVIEQRALGERADGLKDDGPTAA